MPFRTEIIVCPCFMIPKINWFHIRPKINQSIEYSYVEIYEPWIHGLRGPNSPKLSWFWSAWTCELTGGGRLIPVPESEWIKNDSPSFRNEIFLRWISKYFYSGYLLLNSYWPETLDLKPSLAPLVDLHDLFRMKISPNLDYLILLWFTILIFSKLSIKWFAGWCNGNLWLADASIQSFNFLGTRTGKLSYFKLNFLPVGFANWRLTICNNQGQICSLVI